MLLVFCTFVLWIIRCEGSVQLPYCSVPVQYKNGLPDVETTIYNCSFQSNSPYEIPSTFAGVDPVMVGAQIVFNNLVEINDLQETLTFDCKLRLVWFDNRFNITQLMKVLNPTVVSNGIEISQLYNSQGNPLQIWRPDIHFVDAQSQDVLAETFRIKADGQIYYSRHFILTLSEPVFDYSKYPLDKQTADIRFESYSYPAQLMNLSFVDPPVRFYQSADESQVSFGMNALWTFDSYSTTIQYPYYPFLASSKTKRAFASAVISVNLTRRSEGPIIRLALPIMFVACLAGFVFWAEQEKRLDFTVTLLLTVSALYIGVIGEIPLVGYVTNMDSFVFSMFVVLFFCVLLHMVVTLMTRSSSEEKNEEGDEQTSNKNTGQSLSEQGCLPESTTRGSVSRQDLDVDSDDEVDPVNSDFQDDTKVSNVENQTVIPPSRVKVNAPRKKRLYTRFFLSSAMVVFGRAILPVFPLVVAFFYYHTTVSTTKQQFTALCLILSFLYFAVAGWTIFIYSRGHLMQKLGKAIVEIEAATNRGDKLMLFDLFCLFCWEFSSHFDAFKLKIWKKRASSISATQSPEFNNNPLQQSSLAATIETRQSSHSFSHSVSFSDPAGVEKSTGGIALHKLSGSANMLMKAHARMKGEGDFRNSTSIIRNSVDDETMNKRATLASDDPEDSDSVFTQVEPNQMTKHRPNSFSGRRSGIVGTVSNHDSSNDRNNRMSSTFQSNSDDYV